MQRVHEALKDDGVVVLLISIDGGGKKAVQAYLTDHRVTAPIVLDERMEVARTFGVRGTPTTYIVDRSGVMVARGVGPVDFESPEFMQYVQGLLARPRG
ncbi:MAG: TlpA family protein disulfide reductase [Nitrospinae bacterium]|nr:TlpA family protein disulfide reductase [Nitrospinota bacterium]